MYTLPTTFYADRKKALAAAPGFMFVAAVAFEMFINPRSGGHFTGDRVMGGLLLAVFGSASLLILATLIRKKYLFSVSEKGVILPDRPAISWADIGGFKIVKIPNIDLRLIGIFFKDRDKYYATLSPAQKKRADRFEKLTEVPVVLPSQKIKGDPDEIVDWLNECLKKYS